MTSLVEVGARHIQAALLDQKRISAAAETTCPIAYALLEATGDEWEVRGNAWASRKRDARRVLLSRRCLRFIRRFDRGDPCEPFRFRLEIQPSCVQKGGSF